MALNTYAALQTAAADWLNRTDLTSQLPDFITLAEAEIKRRLRRSSTTATISITGPSITPPADMAEARSLHLVSTLPSQDGPLRLCTPEMFAERNARSAGIAGRPTDYAYMSGLLWFAPAPDQTYSATLFYFTQLTALSNTNTTNAVLTEAPDAYLYGTLLQAEPYLEHDDRVPLWKAKFDTAIDQLNDVRTREEYGGSIKDVRLPRVFG